MAHRGLMPPEAIEGKTGLSGIEQNEDTGQSSLSNTTIALIGHPYLLYDEYINYRFIKRLKQEGHRIVTPEMLAANELKSAVNSLTIGAYWTYEEEVVGAGGYYLQNGVDGIIGIMAFGCGPDSLMMDIVRRQAAAKGSIPFMCLTVDEHTAEAGIVTRLEAFTDMMRRRKKSKICV
jgi:predicted nucleotide-binding protein (sugar kinase/HSP70/actin superfamily)